MGSIRRRLRRAWDDLVAWDPDEPRDGRARESSAWYGAFLVTVGLVLLALPVVGTPPSDGVLSQTVSFGLLSVGAGLLQLAVARAWVRTGVGSSATRRRWRWQRQVVGVMAILALIALVIDPRWDLSDVILPSLALGAVLQAVGDLIGRAESASDR